MNKCKETSFHLKTPCVIKLRESESHNNVKASNPQKCMHKNGIDGFDVFMLNKGYQAIQKKMLFTSEMLFDRMNPYFEFCVNPGDSTNDFQFEPTRNPEKFDIGNYVSCKDKKGKQIVPLRMIENQSKFFEAILPNGIENKAINKYNESKLTEKNQKEIDLLKKTSDENSAPRKRGLDEDDAFVQEEFKKNKLCMGNEYVEFILKSEESSSHHCVTGNSEEFCTNNLASGRDQSNFFESSLPNEIENKAINIYDESNKLTTKNQQEIFTLKTSTVQKPAPKKLGYDEDYPFTLEEFKKNKLYEGSPYLEFILKCEESNSHLDFTGNSDELGTNKLASGKGKKIVEKSKRLNKNGSDIFGNCLTDKDRNKLKVICPHCTKKVSAPGFVRHLSYCMIGGIRKSRRRS